MGEGLKGFWVAVVIVLIFPTVTPGGGASSPISPSTIVMANGSIESLCSYWLAAPGTVRIHV